MFFWPWGKDCSVAVGSEMRRGGLALNGNVFKTRSPSFPPSLPPLSSASENFILEIYFTDSVSNMKSMVLSNAQPFLWKQIRLS